MYIQNTGNSTISTGLLIAEIDSCVVGRQGLLGIPGGRARMHRNSG